MKLNESQNNWEISHKNLWNSEIYTKFFEYLDRAGGDSYALDPSPERIVNNTA